jgi:hypothetical protein
MDGHMVPDNSSIAMMMMQMTFYAGVDVTVLFDQWEVNCRGFDYSIGKTLYVAISCFMKEHLKLQVVEHNSSHNSLMHFSFNAGVDVTAPWEVNCLDSV